MEKGGRGMRVEVVLVCCLKDTCLVREFLVIGDVW